MQFSLSYLFSFNLFNADAETLFLGMLDKVYVCMYMYKLPHCQYCASFLMQPSEHQFI